MTNQRECKERERSMQYFLLFSFVSFSSSHANGWHRSSKWFSSINLFVLEALEHNVSKRSLRPLSFQDFDALDAWLFLLLSNLVMIWYLANAGSTVAAKLIVQSTLEKFCFYNGTLTRVIGKRVFAYVSGCGRNGWA